MDHGSPTRRELLTLLLSELLQEFHHRASKRWQNVSLGTNPNGAASSLAGACWMPPHPRSCPKPTPEARWTLNYHLTYVYTCLIILILSYCLGNPPSTLIGTGTQQVFRCAAQLPPRLVCRKGCFCLSHIGGRQASKANVSGGSRVNLHRLGTCIVQTWHSSLMKYLCFRVGSQAVFIYHRSIGSIIRWLRDRFWRGLFDISKAP